MTDLEAIVLRRRLGRLAADDLVAWAVSALAAGHDSDSLQRLAGLDMEECARLPDAEELFAAALSDLGLSLPDETVAVREYVRMLAHEIVAGQVSPQEQVSRIHREVLSPMNHPREFMVWCYVGDGARPREGWNLDPDAMVHFDEIPEECLDRAICDLARWYLGATRAAEQAIGPDGRAHG
jgi:hypothetical protein